MESVDRMPYNFCKAIHLCWAWCQRYTKAYACFADFMGKQIVTPFLSQQVIGWECGYHMLISFGELCGDAWS